VYDNPPIACHHDFAQCPFSPDEFPSEVRFVSPHINTRWGQFSLVAAALRALKLLYRDVAPDWFVLMSGADYPTMRSEKVLEELASGGVDALLDFREITDVPSNSDFPSAENPALRYYDSPEHLALAWQRYVGSNVWFPIIRSGPRIGRHTIYLPFPAWRLPFGPRFKAFCGDQWFTGNQKVAEILLNPTDKHMQLRRHLRLRTVPDECYYHTILGNTPHLRISRATRRFADWRCGGHPRNLGLSDLTAITSSNAYFARKFAPDSPVLNEIDRMLS